VRPRSSGCARGARQRRWANRPRRSPRREVLRASQCHDARPVSSALGYARVSTDHQQLAGQTDALAVAACGREFTDQTSGVREDRPGLASLLGLRNCSPTPGATVPSRSKRPVTTPGGRHDRCPIARAVIGAAAVFVVATSCTGTRAVTQPQGQASADPHITYFEVHVKPDRTFPPSPPAPSPSLVHGEITLIQGNGNSSMTTSIPLGTVVHLRLDSSLYDSPASNYPLILAQTSPPPPGVSLATSMGPV